MSNIRIDPQTWAVIVVDVQPTFMPGGELPVDDGDAIVEPGRRLIETLPGVLTIATQDWHPAGHISFASSHEGRQPFETIKLYGHEQTLWPDHAVIGAPNAEFHPGLPRNRFDLILRKGSRADTDSYSAFRENFGPDDRRHPTGLAGYLRERGIERLLFWGLALDVCVAWSARDGVANGFEAHVVTDLCRAVAPEKQPETLRGLKQAGVKLCTAGEVQLAQ